MTGGTSGIGQFAVHRFLQNKNNILILANRTRTIDGAINIWLDLNNLSSVRSFATEVIKTIGNRTINVLVLNAGISMPNILSRTVDGFETTFAVNYLSHFLLIQMLLPCMEKRSTIILTTSGTHDPAEKTMIAPPVHANAMWLAYPEKDPTLDMKETINAHRAYSSSKLCVMLLVRYLNTLPRAKEMKLKVLAYDPGPTPGTGLMQNNNLIMQGLWKTLSVSIIRRLLLPKSNSSQIAGATLASLALNELNMPAERFYVALRRGKITFPTLSQMVQDNELMKNLWVDSINLIGSNDLSN